MKRHKLNLAPFLPDPKARTEGLLPQDKIDGVYLLKREVGEDTIVVVEPRDPENPDQTPSTYELEYFDAEPYLRRILKIPEHDAYTILDRVWNFRRVAFHPDHPKQAVVIHEEPGRGEKDLIPHKLLAKLGANPLADAADTLDSLVDVLQDADPKKPIKGLDRG